MRHRPHPAHRDRSSGGRALKMMRELSGDHTEACSSVGSNVNRVRTPRSRSTV